jgi:hypothetical protein
VPRDDTERAARYEDDPWRPGRGPPGREHRPYGAEHRSHHGPPGPVAQRAQHLLPASFARGERRRSLLRVGEHPGAFRRQLHIAVQRWAARLEQLRQRDRGRGRAGAEDQRTAGEPAVGRRHSGPQVHQRVGVRGGEPRGHVGRAGGSEERPGTRPVRGSPARSESLEYLAPQTAGDRRGVVGGLWLAGAGGRHCRASPGWPAASSSAGMPRVAAADCSTRARPRSRSATASTGRSMRKAMNARRRASMAPSSAAVRPWSAPDWSRDRRRPVRPAPHGRRRCSPAGRRRGAGHRARRA